MLKKLVRSLAKKSGYEILGKTLSYARNRSLYGLIQQEQINLVLDVGANMGQFASELRTFGYTGRIISFEPLPLAHAALRKQAEADRNWTIANRTAIGAETGSIEIHVAGNSVSSSILEMLPSHSQAEPQSSYIGTETVPIHRLDDLCNFVPTDRVLLKIDVQGYERQVLEGAQRVLGNCRAVISEMSLVPLYDGQILAREMWNLMAAEGFDTWSLESGFRHPETLRMLQIDGAFVRSKDGSRA
jgi:FkbM family methyltransferase